MGKPEAYVEDYLVNQAAKLDIWQCKFTSAGTSGVPDRLCIKNGYTVFIETKRKGGAPRKLQVEICNEMISRGAYVFTADTREKIDELFQAMLNKKLKRPKKLT